MKFKQYLVESDGYKVYVDLDGVIVDFVKGVKDRFDIDMNDHNQWDDFKKENWDKVTSLGPKFWSDLPWTKDGKQLWNYVKEYNPVILSAYPKNPGGKEQALSGKRDWLSHHINSNVAKQALLVRSEEKKKWAGDKAILIDDRKDNIQQWINAGGIGILHRNSNDTIKKLKEILEK